MVGNWRDIILERDFNGCNIEPLCFSAKDVRDWLIDNGDTWQGLTSLRTFMAIQHKDLLNEMLTQGLNEAVKRDLS